MKKAIATLCLLAALCGVLAACGAPKPEALLAGKWDASVASLEFNAFEFVPSQDDPRKGTVNLGMIGSLVPGSYEVVPPQGKDAPNVVKITYTLAMFSTTRSYTFTVDATTLTLQGEGSGVAMTYTRETAAAGTTA
ncbi:MAG: hypothetical protein FWF60_03440 [Oscillospiraceae bacterium]|nr:hypothetical protein [Oscillospiraceae bacterium]